MLYIGGDSKGANGGGVTTGFDASLADFIAVGVCAAAANLSAVTSSLSDNYGNTFDLSLGGVNDGSSFSGATIAFITNPNVGPGYQVTFGGGSHNQAICVAAYKRCNGGFNKSSAGGGSSGSTTVQPGAVTPDQAQSLILTVAAVSQFGASFTVNQSFTSPPRQYVAGVGGQYYGCLLTDLFQAAAASVNPTLTSTLSTNALGARTHIFKGSPELLPFCQIPAMY